MFIMHEWVYFGFKNYIVSISDFRDERICEAGWVIVYTEGL